MALDCLALVIPKGIGVGAPVLPRLRWPSSRCGAAPGIPRPILVGVGGLVARGGGGVVAFGSSGAVCPVALGIGAFRATPADTGASMILSLRTTRKHVAAVRSDGNLAAPVTCAIVRPTKPGVPDLPLGLNRSMLPARKQNGAVAPWNHYSRVPLFPRSLAGGGNERHHLSHRPDRSHLGDPFVFRPALRGRRWSISPPFDATPWPLPST